MSPGVAGKPSLVAKLGQELLAIPTPFDGDLREEKAATTVVRDHQAVPADHDFISVNRRHRGKDADLDLETNGLFGIDGHEAWIFGSGGDCCFDDCLVQRIGCQYVPDAASEMSIEMKGGKRSAFLREVLGGKVDSEFVTREVSTNGLMRQAEKLLPL